MRVVIGNIIRANKLFKFFNKNDRIAVGVSGGKDSLVLLQALDIFCKKLNKQNGWHLKVKGFLVGLSFRKINYDSLILWAKNNKLDLEIIESDVADVLDKQRDNKSKIQCSLCSKMKKAILIKTMRKQGFNKLALGHHADDAIETFFMNMLNESRLATLMPKMYMDRNKVWVIRPLILCREKEIIKVSKKYNLPIIKNVCPNEHNTQRIYMKDFIENNFYQSKVWPNSYVNIIRSFLNKDGSYMWFNVIKKSSKKQM